jgi:hypothetical protein
MKPILLNLPMPIQTKRLLIRPPQLGDGSIINTAIVESYDVLKLMMPWAQTVPSIDEFDEDNALISPLPQAWKNEPAAAILYARLLERQSESCTLPNSIQPTTIRQVLMVLRSFYSFN